jgi:hypothetical protein
MNDQNAGLETHLWLRNPAHEVQSSGKPIFLFHCPVCEREFARASVDSNWRAVRVGPFRIEFLSDSVKRAMAFRSLRSQTRRGCS